MPFPIFNLQKIIRDYNKKKPANKKIEKDENFGFQALSQDSLSALVKANDQFIQAPQLFSSQSGKDQVEYKKMLTDAAHAMDSKKFKEHAALYRQDVQKQKNQKWYGNQQKSLSKQSFWSELAGKFTTIRSSLTQLYKKWQKQQDYSHYNSLAIKHVAENILPIFEHYLELASLELQHNKRLPKFIALEFKKYVLQLKHEIEKEKQKLCWAMLGRLEVASKKGDLYADDVTIELTKELKKIGVLKSSAQFPEEQRNLTAQGFEFFHRFIESVGSPQMKTRLKHLAWFREDENFISLQRSHHQLLVPKVLASFIPEKPSRFSLLFGDINFRYQFFKDRLGLMSQIRLLAKQSVAVTSLQEAAKQPSLKVIDELEQELIKEHRKISEFKPNFIQRLFQRQSNTLIKGWLSFLSSQLHEVFNKKLEFLHHVAQQLKTRLDFSLDPELLSSPDFKQFVKSLLETVEKRCKELSVDPSTLAQYCESKHIISQVLSTEGMQPPDKNFREIAKQESSPMHELESVTKFLQNCLQTNLFNSAEDKSNFVSSLEKYAMLIKQYNAKDLNPLLNKVMEKCFMTYLSECVRWNEETYKQNLNQWKPIERLLLTVGSRSIHDRVSSLTDLASKDQWYLWQVKCQSYLQSFNVDQTISQMQPSSVIEQAAKKEPSYRCSVRFFNHRLNSDDLMKGSAQNTFIAPHVSCEV